MLSAKMVSSHQEMASSLGNIEGMLASIAAKCVANPSQQGSNEEVEVSLGSKKHPVAKNINALLEAIDADKWETVLEFVNADEKAWEQKKKDEEEELGIRKKLEETARKELEETAPTERTQGKENDQLIGKKKDDKNESTRSNNVEKNDQAINQRIKSDASTLLHLAVKPYVMKKTTQERKKEIVNRIINLMTPKALEYKTSDTGFTALHTAARYGNIEAAKGMIEKHDILTLIRDNDKMIPLEVALDHATRGQKEMVDYLYSKTRDIPVLFLKSDGANLLCSTIEASFYDIALDIVKHFPELVMEESSVHKMCALEMLVRRPFAFPSFAKLTRWKQYLYSTIEVDTGSAFIENTGHNTESNKRNEGNHLESSQCTKAQVSSTSTAKGVRTPFLTRVGFRRLYDQKLMHRRAIALLKQMLFEFHSERRGSFEVLGFFNKNPNVIEMAIKHGVTEFVEECLDNCEYLTEHRLPKLSMLQMAVAERNEEIVNILCAHGEKYGDKNEMVTTTDDDNNTILHHAAMLAPCAQLTLVSGVALQMQRELQWSKGVESLMPENDKFKMNKKGITAQVIFTEAHEDLMKKGEDWMKDTSGSCMIVAALIATVAFAAASTVPGGNVSDSNNAKNGTPIFLGSSPFTVFVVADTLALFSSITSALMFLAIFTSRFAEKDFLTSLPRKLIIGIATLFVSMTAILGAFCASLFIVVGDRFALAWIPILVAACCPLVLFAVLQLPLFAEMVRTTYWHSFFAEHKYQPSSS